MKAVLAPVGTRGDVQPVLALGVALVKAGHEVSVSVAENFRSLVEAVGLPYVRGGQDAQELMTGRRRKRPSTKIGRMLENGRIVLREQFGTLEDAARGADLIVGTVMSFAAPFVAEHLGIACFRASFAPGFVPTDELPSPLFAKLDGPRWFNRATWKAHHLFEDLGHRALVNEYREKRKLPPVEGVEAHAFPRLTVLMAFDTELAPLPGDLRALPATGSWILESDEKLPPDVEDFLAAGDAPVYIGFGSMPAKDPGERTAAILTAVRRAGCRALVSSGWGGLGEGMGDPRCKVIGAVNHTALFPRLSAVVHHGGSGTTATALRAGVPQIIVPHMFDQHYWAARVHASGLGPAPLKRHFEADALASALRETVGSRAMKERATAMAERLRDRRGAQRAVEIIEERLGARGSVQPAGLRV